MTRAIKAETSKNAAQTQTEDREPEHAKIEVIAALRDGNRLLLICDQLLDDDLQPAGEDFAIKIDGQMLTVDAAHVTSPMQTNSSWSIVTLLSQRILPEADTVAIAYRPSQWFMWSLSQEQSVAPFSYLSVVLDLKSVGSLPLPKPEFSQKDAAAIITDVEAKIFRAYASCIEIEFDTELGTTEQPTLDDFRAEVENRWLTITKISLRKSSNNKWPKLVLILRETLEKNAQLKVSYKSPEYILKTADGMAVNAFSTTTTVADSEYSTVNKQQKKSHALPKMANVIRNFHDLSSTDKNIAKLLGMAPTFGNDQLAAAETQLSDDTHNIDSYEPFDDDDFDQPSEEDSIASANHRSDNIIKFSFHHIKQRAENLQTKHKIAALSGIGICLLLPLLLIFGGNKEVTRQKCVLNYPDGSIYDGQCIEKKRDGSGSYYWHNGDSYKGQWQNDKRHGSGAITSASGKKIESQWMEGNPVGMATITWPKGTQYVGQVKNNTPHGKGTLTYTNGDVYKGDFKEGRKHGRGLIVWSNGGKYEGEYQADKFHGYGTFWSSDGTRFEGKFVNGNSTRDGFCFQPDGSSKKGACDA